MSEIIVYTERHPGRPSKLSPELLDRLVALIGEGNDYTTACSVCGIGRNTRINWMQRGMKEAERIEKGETPDPNEVPFVEFYFQAAQAAAVAESEDVKSIRKSPDWRAKAWLMAHRNPGIWGAKAQLDRPEVETRSSPPITMIVEMCDGEVIGSTPVPPPYRTWRE